MRAEQNMAIQGGGAEFRSGCTATAATFHLGPCDLFQKPHELSYSGGFSGGGGADSGNNSGQRPELDSFGAYISEI